MKILSTRCACTREHLLSKISLGCTLKMPTVWIGDATTSASNQSINMIARIYRSGRNGGILEILRTFSNRKME